MWRRAWREGGEKFGHVEGKVQDRSVSLLVQWKAKTKNSHATKKIW